MTKEEYKQKIIKYQFDTFSRILYRLGITRVKINESKQLNQKWDNKVQVLNPWNPLSYIIVVGVFVLGVLLVIYDEVIPEIVRLFTYD